MLLSLLLLLSAPLFEAQGSQSSSLVLSLDVRPLQPKEGGSVTLTCKVKDGSHMLQFCILKNGEELKMGWRTSPEFQIADARKEDSGSYQCMAKTVLSKFHRSTPVQIHVQGVPVSNVRLETQPQGGYIMEGEKLVLLCLAAGGTGNITFFWYKGTLGVNLETKTQTSLTAKFEIPTARANDTDQYYCAADNGYGPSLSEVVDVAVRIPLSQPTLTLGVPRAQAAAGDVMELHCEASRGSPTISYWFYRDDVPLGSSSAPSGGGASFNLSLTAEHSGNYSCEADNGLRAQRSEVVSLNVTDLSSQHPTRTEGTCLPRQSLKGCSVPSASPLSSCLCAAGSGKSEGARRPGMCSGALPALGTRTPPTSTRLFPGSKTLCIKMVRLRQRELEKGQCVCQHQLDPITL